MNEVFRGEIKDKIITLEDLPAISFTLISNLKKGEKKEAKVVLLSGDLGAGKTTFAQEIAKSLGVTESVISPTFIIKKMYKTSDERFKYLIHVDAYRLENEKEGKVLELDDDIKNEDALILIEWPNKINWKKGHAFVDLKFVDETSRNISIRYAS